MLKGGFGSNKVLINKIRENFNNKHRLRVIFPELITINASRNRLWSSLLCVQRHYRNIYLWVEFADTSHSTVLERLLLSEMKFQLIVNTRTNSNDLYRNIFKSTHIILGLLLVALKLVKLLQIDYSIQNDQLGSKQLN